MEAPHKGALGSRSASNRHQGAMKSLLLILSFRLSDGQTIRDRKELDDGFGMWDRVIIVDGIFTRLNIHAKGNASLIVFCSCVFFFRCGASA